jgi:hypothetical protein
MSNGFERFIRMATPVSEHFEEIIRRRSENIRLTFQPV